MIITLVNTELQNTIHSLSPENTVMFVANATFTTDNVNIKFTLYVV